MAAAVMVPVMTPPRWRVKLMPLVATPLLTFTRVPPTVVKIEQLLTQVTPLYSWLM